MYQRIGVASSHTDHDDRDMKILAVDDDSFVLELIQLFVRQVSAFKVSPMSVPQDALERLRSGDEKFDCLLFDISMPGMDGIELCRQVRKLPAYAKTPIIMLTAMTERSYVDRAFQAGATDYLTKPIDMTELRARLHSAREIATILRDTEQDADAALTTPIPFEREIALTGVPSVLDYTALTNYLMQLSHGNLDEMQVVAVVLKKPESVHSRTTPVEFVQILTDVAQAIDTAFTPYQAAQSYCGSGAFVVMFRKETMEASGALERAVQLQLDKLATARGSDSLPDLKIVIGNPIRPNPGKKLRARKTLDRAIERARGRAAR
jgi:Response regulators consisting of a CheY-like receiver domain and a winged-helix DNA-binding domain